MRGILCGSTVKTNEEYRKVVKNRMRITAAIVIIGIITAAIGFGAKFYLKTWISDYMIGVYFGVGVGLFVSGTILWFKNRLLLNNDEKLKESRLNNTDERIQEISNKSFKAAAVIMLIALYSTALIGGLFYPILVKVLLFISGIFLISYMIAFKYYNSKM